MTHQINERRVCLVFLALIKNTIIFKVSIFFNTQLYLSYLTLHLHISIAQHFTHLLRSPQTSTTDPTKMPSSSFSSTFGHSCRLQYRKLKCKCQRFAEIKIANTANNPLKLFYACKDGTCGFLDWAHPIDCGCNETSHAKAVNVDVEGDAASNDPYEDRIFKVENDIRKIMFDVGQINSNVKLSKVMYTTTMIMVFVVFFLVLVK